jgi:hypothetical protein
MEDLTRPRTRRRRGIVRGRGWVFLLAAVLGWVAVISVIIVLANVLGWLRR